MFSFMLFVFGFLLYYIPYLVYFATFDIFISFLMVIVVLVVSLGILVCVVENVSLYFKFNGDDHEKYYKDFFITLFWGCPINGFVISMLFSINPLLSIFVFLTCVFINIVNFKKVYNKMISEWNENYDNLMSWDIESYKNKFIIASKYLKQCAIFSGVLLYIINLIDYSIKKIKYCYSNIPKISYFSKRLEKAKGFDGNE